MTAAPKQLATWIARCAGIALALALAACASLPDVVQRTASHSFESTHDTPLGRVARASLPADEGLSGLRLLPEGWQAFEARMALAAAARRSIDAQYYQIADDASGRVFLRGLADAAARGVRVRVLLDDLHAAGEDDLLAGLAAQPNVEVRLFNPLAVRGRGVQSRVLLSLNDFSRVNRRMHNKLFVVDNAFAISGGRNIADEYFGRSQPANFIDMDVLAAGKVVREQSAVFDAFWNSENAYPVQSLVDTAPEVAGARFDALARGADLPSPDPVATRDAIGQGSVGAQLANGRIELHFAAVRVMADAPVKATKLASLADGAVMSGNLELLQSAQSDVFMASPYFVPDARTLDILQQRTERGVRVALMTNSLATTDEPLAHFGYSRYRGALVDMGVALYEMMPGSQVLLQAAQSMSPHASVGRLHAKVTVVDQRWLSIGSMNMDRRSAHSNTEMGLIVDSPELAREVATLLQQEQMPRSYLVRRTGTQPQLQWVAQSGPRPQVFHAEPNSKWGRKLRMSVTLLFVSEQLL